MVGVLNSNMVNKLISLDNKIIDCSNIKNIEPRDYGRGAYIEFYTLDKLESEAQTKSESFSNYDRIDPVIVKKGLFKDEHIMHAPIFKQTGTRGNQTQKSTSTYCYENMATNLTYFKVCEICAIDVPNKPKLVKDWLLAAALDALAYHLKYLGMGSDFGRVKRELIEKGFFNEDDKLELYQDFSNNDTKLYLNNKHLILETMELDLIKIMHKIGAFIANDLLEREKAVPVITAGINMDWTNIES